MGKQMILLNISKNNVNGAMIFGAGMHFVFYYPVNEW